MTHTLKGIPPSLTFVASLSALAPRNNAPILFPPEMIGKTGIWFLASGTGNYQILPRARSMYNPGDLFLPLIGTADPVPSADKLDDQLLAYTVRWYQSLKDPSFIDDNALFSSFEQWHPESPKPQQVVSAVAPLIQSPLSRKK